MANLFEGVRTFAHTVQEALEARHIGMNFFRTKFLHEVLYLIIHVALRLDDLLTTVMFINISIFTF
jgi:hypothetical protein